MRCSIVMATRDKAPYLRRTLTSIFRQKVPFDYEVIVVDDGSTDNTPRLCKEAGVRYLRLENNETRNGCEARNVGWKAAKGHIIIAQSDEVIHHTPDAIQRLCQRLRRQTCVLATVYNYNVQTKKRMMLYTGAANPRPFFFLGSIWREDLYAVGGEDETFRRAGYNDDWLGVCLTQGLGLKINFAADVVGYHQDHPRIRWPQKQLAAARAMLAARKRQGAFTAAGGPWENIEQVWDRRHSSDSTQYLSNAATGEEVWTFLDIEQRLCKGAAALEIGVGMGDCTKDVASRGVVLSALDISAAGLTRVKDLTVARYQRAERLPSNTFDVAFSHLVAQYMADADLVAQMREVLRSLKPSGILAMQFASGPARAQHLRAQRHGDVCRPPSVMRQLIEQAGGEIVWKAEPREKLPTVRWQGVHIRRRV